MTGATLGQVLAIAKAEIGITGNGDDPMLRQRIVNQNAWFANNWDWSMFRDRWDVPVVANVNYYSFPTKDYQGTDAVLRLDRPLTVQAFWNNRYHDLWYGIGAYEYNVFNPELGLTQNPVQKWQWIGNDQTKFEVWPMPASAHKVRFVGTRQVQCPAVPTGPDAPQAIIDIDDLLVAQTVAAQYMREKDMPGWDTKMSMAKDLLTTLKANDPQEHQIFRIGRDMEGEMKRRAWPLAVTIVKG